MTWVVSGEVASVGSGSSQGARRWGFGVLIQEKFAVRLYIGWRKWYEVVLTVKEAWVVSGGVHGVVWVVGAVCSLGGGGEKAGPN